MPPGCRGLGDHGRPVGLALADRERDAERVGVGPPRTRVVAARDLAAALEEVADDDAGGEPVPVVPRPAVLVHQRGEEQRRVGNPSGDDDVARRASSASTIGRAPRYAFANSASGGSPSSFARGRTSSPTTVATVSPDAPAALSVVDHGAAGRDRVDAAGVGDEPRAPVDDVGQRRAQVRAAGHACSRAHSSRWRSFCRMASVSSASASHTR